jgi:tetratricopeptide (TPR) repeat protein
LCLLVLCTVPNAARAQDNFHRYYSAAVRLYNAGESEQALEQFQQAKARTYAVQQDVMVALYEGLILLELGPKEKALAALETGLLLDPDVELPVMVSPKVKEEFEALRERVRKKLARRQAPKSQDRPSRANLDPPEPPAQKTFEPQPELAEQYRGRLPTAVPLALAGVGVVAAGVGAVFGHQSRSNAKEADYAYKNGLPSQTETLRIAQLLDDAHGQARTANVMFGTAALALGGAVATWLLTGDDSDADLEGEP